MEFVRSLRQLVAAPLFRRLLAVRVATQSARRRAADRARLVRALLPASASPTPPRSPTVLAITLLPFSILGPFVGVVLDRWSRRQILVVVDLAAAGAGARAWRRWSATGLRTGGAEAVVLRRRAAWP